MLKRIKNSGNGIIKSTEKNDIWDNPKLCKQRKKSWFGQRKIGHPVEQCSTDREVQLVSLLPCCHLPPSPPSSLSPSVSLSFSSKILGKEWFYRFTTHCPVNKVNHCSSTGLSLGTVLFEYDWEHFMMVGKEEGCCLKSRLWIVSRCLKYASFPYSFLIGKN